jgi:enamine deaminase RidA (YjgF/YER057c/UK114 family)
MPDGRGRGRGRGRVHVEESGSRSATTSNGLGQTAHVTERRPTSQPVRVSSGSPFEATIGFSRLVRSDDRILVSGTGPVWPDGSCPDDPAEQARRCFEIIAGSLAQVGAALADVVRTRMFLTSASDATAVGSVHSELLGATRPAATMVVVAALLDPRWKVEIEAEAIVGVAPE